ncbi:hypothetical protein [Brumimicrobium mesophilum]|uniref:hypothetical protein n=1 Tax=Brumimicrobium mesophilum TaxID=392717 RepID=UPI00131CD184|nr:hypothetical protein [Brumimicrobium mesophilum]
MSVKERLKRFIKYENLKTKEFESLIKASNGYVNSISKGIGEDKLSNIREHFPNLNVEWLLRGEGSMLKIDQTIRGAYDKVMEGAGISKAMENISTYSSLSQKRDVEEVELENKLLINKVDFLTRENKLLTEMIELIKKKP